MGRKTTILRSMAGAARGRRAAARTDAPPAFHVMAKPTGSACNLRCDYCFYLKKEALYPGADFRMPEPVHEAYIRQLLEAHRVPRVTVAWQGGEPTLMGLDFYRRSVELQERFRKPGMVVENTFQTNGVLLDDDWCRFFHDHGFLVGLSLDGPRELHDVYRKDRAGHGTYDRVARAARLLRHHEVEWNVLCAVNAANSRHPSDVYRFFRDGIGARYIQFIPVVERDGPTGAQEGNRVTARSVDPAAFGRFLIGVFDEWVRGDVGTVFVVNFDGALAGWLDMAGTLCLFGPTCGLSLALEFNGDLYSCDHFVEPRHLLGNILETPMIDLVASAKQRAFGRVKEATLSRDCRDCEFLSVCHGECPKNRFVAGPGGETGRNYLCPGYKAFFRHADGPMRVMADLIRRGRPASEVMARRGNGPA